MARLIDADALKAKANADPDSGEGFVWVQDIDEAPTVDAVPVVRCKNCLYYQETIGKDSGKPCGYGSCRVPVHITGIVYDEDFCSYGESGID